MTVQKLTVTDIERKAIAFCKEKEITFPIANYLVAFAEKQIEELEKEVTRLRNENLDIINKYTRFAETDRRTIADLEAQIEKMKCCPNCDFSNYRFEDCYYNKECKNKDHWKLRR